VDGYTNGQWVLVDCNDVVVNIFQKETRELYRLESLWKVPASKEELQAMASAADGKEGKQQ
jgi:ribosomal silencing factor RsfS